jgi:hypothetical protein
VAARRDRQRLIAGVVLALASSSASAAWLARVQASPADGQTLSLRVRSTSGSRPTQLVISCSASQTQIYFDAGRIISRASSYGSAIRVRYDAQEPMAMIAGRSPDFHAVFLDPPSEHLKSLLKAKRVLVEYAPQYEGPMAAEFDVSGLDQHLQLLKRHCRL